MKRLWLILALLLVVGGAASYYYLNFEVSEPVLYSNDEVYLTRYASVVMPSGVYGFSPGTKLLLLPARRASPGMVSVTDGKYNLEVAPDALTRNPAIAQQYADADRSGQKQAAAGVAAEKARVIKVEADAQLARARDIERLNAVQRSAVPKSTLTPTPTPPTLVRPGVPPPGR